MGKKVHHFLRSGIVRSLLPLSTLALLAFPLYGPHSLLRPHSLVIEITTFSSVNLTHQETAMDHTLIAMNNDDVFQGERQRASLFST